MAKMKVKQPDSLMDKVKVIMILRLRGTKMKVAMKAQQKDCFSMMK
jgi:hypothetical protein